MNIKQYKQYIPDFKDPRNEVVIYGNWTIAILSVMIPLISSADFTTLNGVIAFLTAAVALWQRMKVSSEATVASIRNNQNN